MIYLDNNGTTFMTEKVTTEIARVLKEPLGNPASHGVPSQNAAALLADARQSTADLIGTDPDRLIFTSSGSESNVAVIRAATRLLNRPAIVVSAIEHASISALVPRLDELGIDVRVAPVLPSGVVDMEALSQAVDQDVALVSLQAVNNETGVIQPIEEACAAAHNAGALFHTDAAQAVGKSNFAVTEADYDFVTFTGHKFHAPAGVAAIYARDGFEGFPAHITGGSQEFGVRGGTHNMLGIVGMGAAAKARRESLAEAIEHMRSTRDLFEQNIMANLSGCKINGNPVSRVANTANILFEDIDGKALYAQLLDADVICSQSSACTAQYPEPSKVLRAMGLTYHQAFSSIRFSFSAVNTLDEAEEAADVVIERATRIKNVLGGVW